jgi:hypothetical protein
MPKRMEWRISEKASQPTSTEAPCQKKYIFFQNFKTLKFRKLKKKIGPPFLGPVLNFICGLGLNYILPSQRFDYLTCFLLHGNA